MKRRWDCTGYLDDGRAITWQTGRESIPRMRHSLETACVERLGNEDVRPVGLNRGEAPSKEGFQI